MVLIVVGAACLVVAAAATFLTNRPVAVAFVGAALAAALVLASIPRKTTSEGFEGPAWLAAAIVAVPGLAAWLGGVVVGVRLARLRGRR